MKKSKLMLAVAALTGLMSWATSHGALTLYFKDETSTVTPIADNSILDDDDTVGVISYSYFSSAGTLTVTLASSNATTGAALNQPATLQQTSLQFNGAGGSGSVSFEIAAADDSFTFPGAIGTPMRLNSRLTGTFTSAIGASVAFQSGATPDTVVTPFLSYTAAADGQFDFVNDVVFNRSATPYTVANDMIFTIPVRGSATLTGVTTVYIPEPSSMISLLGLPALAIRRRAR
jgi:hypothetical protein